MCKTSWRATSANRRRRRLPFQATPRSERSRTSPRLVCPSVRFAISQQDRFLSILRVSLLYSGRRARLSVLLCSVQRPSETAGTMEILTAAGGYEERWFRTLRGRVDLVSLLLFPRNFSSVSCVCTLREIIFISRKPRKPRRLGV